jgi:formylglycine-generating enzyme required for sulfatase activity
VALLAGAKAARGSSAMAWQLVHELCFLEPVDNQSPEEDVCGAQIAARILLGAVDLAKLSDANRRQLGLVRRWLLSVIDNETLSPAERVEEGKYLAALGDPRFDPLNCYLPNELMFGFVEIPAGSFLMGSDKRDDPDALENELAQHEVFLPTYYLARWPVTVAQFGNFLDERNLMPYVQSCREGGMNMPVNHVSWRDALAYCHWLNQQLRELAKQRLENVAQLTGTELRFWQGLSDRSLQASLPSEAEWEKAARGEDDRIFPWGNQADPVRANSTDMRIGGRSPVGCFTLGCSPLGCEDMSGNLCEWTRSRLMKYPYPSDDKKRKERENLSGNSPRVLRGGSFDDDLRDVRCARRYYFNPVYRYPNIGFRVVVSSLPSLHDDTSGL